MGEPLIPWSLRSPPLFFLMSDFMLSISEKKKKEKGRRFKPSRNIVWTLFFYLFRQWIQGLCNIFPLFLQLLWIIYAVLLLVIFYFCYWRVTKSYCHQGVTTSTIEETFFIFLLVRFVVWSLLLSAFLLPAACSGIVFFTGSQQVTWLFFIIAPSSNFIACSLLSASWKDCSC